MSLLDRRLVVVTGKGGVGRTTVAAAIAVAAAAQGKRTCVIELSGMASVPAAFGVYRRSYAPQRMIDRVDAMSLTPTECLDDFGRRKLRLTALLGVVLRSRVTSAFIEAVPGLHDLLQLGKIENLIHEPLPGDPIYDLVVLDAPATGHGLTMLAAARSMREMTRVGPFHDLARNIEDFLSDRRRAAIVLTTLPEALPVSESMELIAALREDQAELAAVVVNQVRPDPLPDHRDWPMVRSALLDALPPEASGARALVELADRVAARQESQTEVLSGLAEAVADANHRPTPVVHLPRLPGDRLDLDGLRQLADHLSILGDA